MSNPPMKFNWDASQSAFDIIKRIRVKLDGEPQSRVLAYDCHAGTIERLKSNKAKDILSLQNLT